MKCLALGLICWVGEHCQKEVPTRLRGTKMNLVVKNCVTFSAESVELVNIARNRSWPGLGRKTGRERGQKEVLAKLKAKLTQS